MTAYIDASVLLRVVLGQSNALPEWSKISRGISSVLIRTEGLRTLDRLRLARTISDVDMAKHREKLLSLLNAMELVELGAPVLNRAEQPMPTSLGSLDAIHLATSLLWQESENIPLTFATHDEALARGAQAHGVLTIGV